MLTDEAPRNTERTEGGPQQHNCGAAIWGFALFVNSTKKVAARKDGHSCVGKLWLDLALQVAPCHPKGAQSGAQ